MEARAGMDSDIARYEDERKEKLRQAAMNALANPQADETPRIRMLRLKLALKKPGIKALLGENPLKNEEFGELEKYFRLSKERV